MAIVPVKETTRDKIGYGRSEQGDLTVESGETLSTDTLDFGRSYFVFVIRIPNCSGIDADTAMRLKSAIFAGTDLCDVYEANEAALRWSKGALPITGSVSVLLTHLFGARYLQIDLSVMTTGDVAFEVVAFDDSVGDVPALGSLA